MNTIPQLDHFSGSWIITSIATGQAIFETYERTTAEKVNQSKYRVETTYQYLCRFNRELKDGIRDETGRIVTPS